MRRMVSCALLLCVACLCLLSAAADAPGPTPEPTPVAFIPSWTGSMEGVNAAQWKEAFLACAGAQEIPVEEGGFQLVFERERRTLFDAAC